MAPEDSILNLTKRALGIETDYDVFDMELIMYINGVFSTLHQLGVGPEPSFAITDDTTKWSEFIGPEMDINSVKTYMVLSVKLLFDPPQTSFAIESFAKQKSELEWRLNVVREGEKYPYVEEV